VSIPTEGSEDAPMNKPTDVEMQPAREYRKLVAEIAEKLHS
jgi:NAD(P)H dehydrogenase (quinone)